LSEFRKVQVTGGSTFTISLPKKWAGKHIKKGDRLALTERGNSIVISMSDESSKRAFLRITFTGNPRELLRKAISAYLNGYETIQVEIEHELKERNKIKKLIKDHLPGLEVVDENPKYIRFQNLLEHSKFPFRSTLKRMYFVASQMLSALQDAAEKNSISELDSLKSYEQEADRFSMLGLRQLISAVSDSNVMGKLKIPSERECTLFIIVVRRLEEIADHALKHGIILKGLTKKERKKLSAEIKDTNKKFNEVMNALFTPDPVKSEKIIQDLEKEDVPSSRSVAYHLAMIRKYTMDIAEIVLDLSYSHM